MIHLSNKLIRDAIQRLDYGEAASPGAGQSALVHLVGIRSCQRLGPETLTRELPRFNEYDDAICAFGAHLEVFRGTVDPGKRWTIYPTRPEGCAHLADGGPSRYVVGLHKGKPALIQAGPVRIWRDRDRDGTQDGSEIVHTETGNGIDIHRMGFGPSVDEWSAGCQGIPLSHWDEFWQIIEGAHARGQREFLYWVIDGSHLI